MVRISAREKVLGVLVGAIAGNCSDASAIHLRHRVGQAVGHYAIGSAGVETKRKKCQLEGREIEMVLVMSLFLAWDETYRTWGIP